MDVLEFQLCFFDVASNFVFKREQQAAFVSTLQDTAKR